MDGVRLHAHQALAMTREQALQTLLVVGSEQDKHDSALLLAGPVLTEDDVEMLSTSRYAMKPMVMCVRLAIAKRLLCAA